MNDFSTRANSAWAARLFGAVLAIIGVALGWGGVELLTLGGSAYYLLTGLALLASGALLMARKPLGLLVFALVFIGTVIWALIEVGLQFWPLMPRLAPVVTLGIVAALVAPCLLGKEARKSAWSIAGVLAVFGLGGLASVFQPHGVIEAKVQPTEHQKVPVATEGADAQWQYYGRTPHGTRFAPLEQITRDNVDQLEVAWTFRTGEENGPGTKNKGSEDQNTPMQIGDTLYLCTPRNTLIALDADKGTEKWRFESGANSLYWNRCRGLGYYEVPTAPSAPTATAKAADALCQRRVVMTTVDARLMQFDAATGAQCTSFGDKGTVDLKAGLGQVKQSYYFPTSAPTVVDHKVIVGGWVFDGREVDEPSGAVRAFDAATGKLVWAWDLGNLGNAAGPKAGETYTRSTPNVWTTPAVDEKAGLIYLPTGNCPSDFFGGHKPEICDEYNASIVAVDLKTGKEKWKFRTVNHDIWDYDIPAQPALYDIPDGKGGVQPALIQVTKRGQTFVLNRLTGEPLSKVEEKPVTAGNTPGERYAPTQPYSVDFPALGFDKPLTEASMWGATWFDQLACRIKFKKLNYAGDFTAPMVGKGTIFYPGFLGGMNWGSVSINENNGYLIVNDVRLTNVVELVPRADADKRKADMGHGDGMHPQANTPYASLNTQLQSPLGVPCHAPPWGMVSAIDLKTKQVVWQRPMGTVEDVKTKTGFGVPLPIPLGMPTLSGPMTTASGLVFYAGTQDFYLRAMDVATGKELWKGRLPVGGQATPMTYVSPATGTQYVALSVGGARTSPVRGDYVIAYKLKGK